jgi:hypothetical protein
MSCRGCEEIRAVIKAVKDGNVEIAKDQFTSIVKSMVEDMREKVESRRQRKQEF